MALTVAATFTMTFCVSVVMPDKAKMFGLGWIARDKQCQCGGPSQREKRPKLASV